MDEGLTRAIQLYKIYTAFKRYCNGIVDNNKYHLTFYENEEGQIFYYDSDNHGNLTVIAEWSTLEEGVEVTEELLRRSTKGYNNEPG